MARGRAHSPETIERGLQALAENGGSLAAASRVTGIPATTLQGWKTKYNDEFVEVRCEKRTNLIQEVWKAAEKALEQVVTKMGKASAKEAAVILGILVDKALVMGGEPGSITETKITDARSNLLAAIEREMESSESKPQGEDYPESY